MLRLGLWLCVLALLSDVASASSGTFHLPDDLVVPCTNFREVLAPRGAGCRKRIKQLPTHSDERHDLSVKIDQLLAAGPNESWMRKDDWEQVSTYMLPVRVGLTASLTGSRSSAGSLDSIKNALEGMAVKAIKSNVRLWGLYQMCIEICLEDDKSDKFTALKIYERFANPSSEYDVDLLMGPATVEFQEDVAGLAHKYDKLLMLWSYGSSHYDHGLGSTRGRFGADVSGERVYIHIGRNLPERASGELLRPYVNYSATNGALQGLTATSSNGSNPTWDQNFLLSPPDFPVLVFEVKDQLGDEQLPDDPVVAEGKWQSSDESLTEVISLQKPSKPVDGYTYPPQMQLHLVLVLEDHALVVYWAERFLAYNASMNEVVTELREVSQSSGIKPPIHDMSAYLDYEGVSSTLDVSGYSFAWMHGTARETFDVLASRPQSNSVWRVEGPCVVDATDCLTSPNFPSPYTALENCFAIASEVGSTARRLVMKRFDTEAFHDTLLLNGSLYHGHDVELGGIALTGHIELQWYPDDSVAGSGWRICPVATVLARCDDFACSAGMRHKLDAYKINCTADCSDDKCCRQAVEDVDSSLFTHGYTNLIDLTVPKSRWALHPLGLLKERGAKSLGAVVTGLPEATTLSRCNTTQHLAREELGYELVSEDLKPFDWTFASTDELINDAFIEAEVDVLLLCGDMMTNGLFLTMEESRHVNHGAVLLMQPFGQALSDVWQGLINYVIEPLPWPSPLWIWDNIGGDLPETVADLQISSVGQMLSNAVEQLPRGQEVWPSLNAVLFRDILFSTQMRTYMGDIAFNPDGKRTTVGGLSSRQFYPLSEMRGFEPKATWTYWQARSIFSENYIVAHNLTRVQELAKIYPETFEARYRELVYPAPFWEEKVAATYPCPLGCTAIGTSCRPCPPGTKRSATELDCVPCPSGTLATTYGLSSCQECPSGANCNPGPGKIPLAQPGFWDTSTLSGEKEQDQDICSPESGVFPGDVHIEHPERVFLPCDPPVLCTGGPRGMGCKGHNAGVMCRSCETGFSWQYFGSGRRLCVPCPSQRWIIGYHLSPVLMTFLLLMILWEFSAARGSLDPNSLVCPLLKLTFHHFTIFNVILEGMKLDTLPDLPNTWDVITRPQEVSYIDCLSSVQDDEVRAFNEIFAAIGFTVFGFMAVFTVMCVRLAFLQGRIFLMWSKRMIDLPEPETGRANWKYMCWRYMVIQEQQRMMKIINSTIRQCTIWQILCFPIITRAGAVILNQSTIDGECRISKFLDVTCDSEVYRAMVLPAAWAAVFMSVALPVPLAVAIYKHRKSLQEVDVRLFLAPFVHGYKQGLELCEIGYFLRMVVVLLSLSQKSFARMVMIFSALAVNQAMLVQLQPFVPQERNLLERYAKFSFRILMFIFCMGATFSFANDVTVADLLDAEAGGRNGSILTFIGERIYSVTFVCFFLNGCLLSTTACFIFYNQVVVPNAIKIISGDRDDVNPCIRKFIAGLKFHAVQLVEEDDGHLSMNVAGLTDGERRLLNQGIFQTVVICLKVNTVSFSMLNAMRVLLIALQRAGAAHCAKFRLHEDLNESCVYEPLKASEVLNQGVLRGFFRRHCRRYALWRERENEKDEKAHKEKGVKKVNRHTTVTSLDVAPTLISESSGKLQVDVMVDELYTYLRDVHIDIVKRHPLMHFVHPHKATHPDHPHHSTARRRKRTTLATVGDDNDEFSAWCAGDEEALAVDQSQRGQASQSGIERLTRGRSRMTDQTASRSIAMDFLGPGASASLGLFASEGAQRPSLGPGASASLGLGFASEGVASTSVAQGEARASASSGAEESAARASASPGAEPAARATASSGAGGPVATPAARRTRRSKKLSKEAEKELADQEMVAAEMTRLELFQQTNEPSVFRRRLLELRNERDDLRQQLKHKQKPSASAAALALADAPRDSQKPDPKDSKPTGGGELVPVDLEDPKERKSGSEPENGTSEGELPLHNRKEKVLRPTEVLQRRHELEFPDPLPPPPGPPPPSAPKIGFIGMRWPGKKSEAEVNCSVVGSV